MGHHDLLSKMSTLNYVSDDAETIPWFNEAELEDDDEAGRDGVASGRGGEAVEAVFAGVQAAMLWLASTIDTGVSGGPTSGVALSRRWLPAKTPAST